MFSPSSKERVPGITKVLLVTPSEIAVLRTRSCPKNRARSGSAGSRGNL